MQNPTPEQKPKPKGFVPKPMKRTRVTVASEAEKEAGTPQDAAISLQVDSTPVGEKGKAQELAQAKQVVRGIFARVPNPALDTPVKLAPPEVAKEASKKLSIFGTLPKAMTQPQVQPQTEIKEISESKVEEKPTAAVSTVVETETKPVVTETSVVPPPPAESKPATRKRRTFLVAPGTQVPTEEETPVPPPTTPRNQLKGTALEELARGIEEIERSNPYKLDTPKDGYVPETRRGFSNFIKQYYKRFTLPLPNTDPNYDACAEMGKKGIDQAQMYQYQEFIREYMRWESPYRGVLVYHGLGSGKTCTAIAASEALFSTGAQKRIIVMTPKSLKKNFIKEITKCGFRHFRLQNHWVSLPLDRSNPLHELFATTVMKIPASYLRGKQRFWVPKFTEQPNFNTLTSDEQQEIRDQISATLIYDPDSKPKKDGLIWFIHYNGVPADKLKTWACDPDEKGKFDDAIIIVDEIHNIVRTIQGTIEPYLLKLPGKQRKVPVEPISPFKWKPELCGREVGYKRGYLFYRLLTGARNSKIIGLSGTPLINYPEEIGILANILHGYIDYAVGHIAKGATVEESNAKVKKIEEMAMANPYIDFVKASLTDDDIQFIVTTLPERIRKIQEKQGDKLVTKETVERIPDTIPDPSFKSRIDGFFAELVKERVATQVNPVKYNSEPVLPPFSEPFSNAFMKPGGVEVKNPVVFMKRMTGLISYYKGARKDLMPMVTKDVVVRVPMTPYSQEKYSLIRREEILDEEEKKKRNPKAGTRVDWSLTTDIAKLKLANSYRMGSRQLCNFSFPPGVNRPRPHDETEARMEIGTDTGKDITDEIPEDRFGEDDEDTKSVLSEDEADEAAADAADAAIEQAEFEATVTDLRAQLAREGKSEEEIRKAIDSLRAQRKDEEQPSFVLAEAKTPAAARPKDPKLAADCAAAQYEDETYAEALARSKRCLKLHTPEYLKLDGKLSQISPKYQAMLTNILAAKGSSLVYSQFLDMEGIGIFSLVLDENGWVPIKINMVGGKPQYDPATLKSFEDASKPVNRYIRFTGGEDDAVRKMSIDIFNANFNELPEDIRAPLKAYKDNMKGELCRLFCITSAGAEGLSLKNVRAVHIMESYWNDVRLTQVKGRAVRICSHQELPKAERTVDIFTYISVFGPEAQTARAGSMKIDETIARKDAIPASEAKALGVEGIPEGAEVYIATSDDYLYLVSQRKKLMIDNLQKLLKQGAVDCELNILENDDGSYTCNVFKGGPGDFLYHPLLETELSISESKYTHVDLDKTARELTKIVKVYGVPHRLKPVFDPETKKITRYDIFELTDQETKEVVGSVQVDDQGKIIPSTATLSTI